MEPYYKAWEQKWHAEGGKDINNPKIPLRYVADKGHLLYGARPPLSKTRKARRASAALDAIIDADE